MSGDTSSIKIPFRMDLSRLFMAFLSLLLVILPGDFVHNKGN